MKRSFLLIFVVAFLLIGCRTTRNMTRERVTVDTVRIVRVDTVVKDRVVVVKEKTAEKKIKTVKDSTRVVVGEDGSVKQTDHWHVEDAQENVSGTIEMIDSIRSQLTKIREKERSKEEKEKVETKRQWKPCDWMMIVMIIGEVVVIVAIGVMITREERRNKE